MLVEVDPTVLCDNSPNPNVKLASIEQKRLFHVLLDYPRLRLRIFMIYELLYVAQIFEDLNTFALIHGGWFDKPHILLAVFDGDSLLL